MPPTSLQTAVALRVKAAQRGWKPPQSYKDRPIEYIDPAPKPLVAKIPLIEYFERIKRLKADRWQCDFCSRLQKAAEERHLHPTKSITHAEPQLGKSSLLVQTYPAWLLGHDPFYRIALATYNVRRSQAHSKAVLQIMNLPVHKLIFPDPEGHVPETTSKEKWQTNARSTKTTDAQDSFNPVGLQSGLTGSGFDVLLLDDPYADQKEAFSDTNRQNLQDFWEYTVLSRLGEFSNVFGMFHRYHVEDLAGYLLNTGQFEYWRYATVADGPYIHPDTGQSFDDPLGRPIGEYISERRGDSYYIDKRKNKRVWMSMNQGRPSAEQGEFFDVGQIQELTRDEMILRKAECSVFVRSWDLASTEEGGDYSVGGLWGMSQDKRATLFDVKRKQVDSAGRDKLQLDTAIEDGLGVVISIPKDPGAAGDTAVFHIQQLLKDYQVVVSPTSGSKIDRARPFASAVNEGRVEFGSDDHLDDDLKWNKVAKKELRDFPLSEHDDVVDMSADGYNECYTRIIKGLVAKGFVAERNLVEDHNFTSWMEAFLRQDDWSGQLPANWLIYVGVKITPDASTANSAIIAAKPPQNAGMESLFVIAEYKEFTADFEQLFIWLAQALKTYCVEDKATIWLHPDSEQFVPTIRHKLERKVRLFEEDRLAGLTEMNWYFAPTSRPHPFYDGEKAANLYGIVRGGQFMVATDSRGLYHMRQEALTWGYDAKHEPTQIGGVLDCLRMVAYKFKTRAVPLTFDEKVNQALPPELRPDNLGHITGKQRERAQYGMMTERARIEEKMKHKSNKHAKNPFDRLGEWK